MVHIVLVALTANPAVCELSVVCELHIRYMALCTMCSVCITHQAALRASPAVVSDLHTRWQYMHHQL